MMIVIFLLSSLLTSCTALAPWAQTIDDIATDDCVTIKVDRDAFQKDTDVEISVKVINKDSKVQAIP